MDAAAPVHLEFIENYRFELDFGHGAEHRLRTDAAPPLGQGAGPDSEQLLVAAVANCLAGSLAFALRKYRNDDVRLQASADAVLAPNERGRQRVQRIDVVLRLGRPARDVRLIERALAQYEDYCVVTQSVRAAIPVTARVFDAEGVLLAGA